jgi:hypothetical protein
MEDTVTKKINELDKNIKLNDAEQRAAAERAAAERAVQAVRELQKVIDSARARRKSDETK